jgi:uncharacterized protein (DUF3084 family)
MERERLANEEQSRAVHTERAAIGHNLSALEQENNELRRRVQTLDHQISQMEQEHAQRLMDIASKHRQVSNPPSTNHGLKRMFLMKNSAADHVMILVHRRASLSWTA